MDPITQQIRKGSLMKIFRPLIMFLLLVTLLTLSLSACEFEMGKLHVGSVRLGMYGSNIPGQIAYSYSTFTGYEQGTFLADVGQTIHLYYQVTIEKGALYAELQDPNGEVIWQKSFEQDESEGIEVTVSCSGQQTLVIEGKDTGGSFDFTWEIK